MGKEEICYCGLYCGNCIQKQSVTPAAIALRDQMKQAGYEEFGTMLPGFEPFFEFLNAMAEQGACTNCMDGGGNPYCGVRICVKEKGIKMCAFCEEYPCETFRKLFLTYPTLFEDNLFLKEHGMDKWLCMQQKRQARGYVYTEQSSE